MSKLICYEIKSKASKQCLVEGQCIYQCQHGLTVLQPLYMEILEKHGLNYEDNYVLIKGVYDC